MEERNLHDDEQRANRTTGDGAGAREAAGEDPSGGTGAERALSRRGALRAGAAAVGSAAGLAAASGSAAADRGRTRREIEFDRVLHAVDDLGMDPEGEESDLSQAIAHVVESYDRGEQPVLSADHALRSTEIIFGVWESARRRGRVEFPLEVDDNPLEAMVEAGDLSPAETE